MHKTLLALLAVALLGCQMEEERSDAYGNFEASTVLISAQAQGPLVTFDVAEGQDLDARQLVGLVDTSLLHLQREQVRSRIGILPSKLQNSLAEIAVLERQQSNLERERDRVARLVDRKAATPKQLDDLNGELGVVQKRIAAIKSGTNTTNQAILSEKGPLLAQINLLDEQIRRAYIYNPIAGKVLTKLAEPGELVNMGSPLYRIGKLDTLQLHAYTTAELLQNVKVGQMVEVLVDSGADDYRKLEGIISKIADEAEFTPKTIQTKEDRVNLVYAFEVSVPNPDGLLKIGMPAEVNFPGSATAKTAQ